MIMTCLWVNPGIAADYDFGVHLSDLTCEELQISWGFNDRIAQHHTEAYRECMTRAINNDFDELYCGFIYEHEKAIQNIMERIANEYLFRCEETEEPKISV